MTVCTEMTTNGRSRRCTQVWAFILLGAVLVSMLAATMPAAAGGPLNLDADGYAIGRYDPVAYFTVGKAIKGDVAHTASYDGANYAFASEEHRQIFLQDPDKFVPQYGGHCAYGAVYGGKSSIDPEIWEIVDGRLFFMINPGTMTLWQKRKADYIKIADQAWKSVVGQN